VSVHRLMSTASQGIVTAEAKAKATALTLALDLVSGHYPEKVVGTRSHMKVKM